MWVVACYLRLASHGPVCLWFTISPPCGEANLSIMQFVGLT
jgi:hypothetical protein